jgi:hypothetical protein
MESVTNEKVMSCQEPAIGISQNHVTTMYIASELPVQSSQSILTGAHISLRLLLSAVPCVRSACP